MVKSFKVRENNEFDVVVIGGGPAGCTAAAAAGREGVKTLLLESGSCLGGMGTSGLIPAWCPFYDGKNIVYGGMAKEIFLKDKATLPHIPAKRLSGWLPLNPEHLKRVYDDLVTQYGVTVRFLSRAFEVETDGNGNVTGVVVLEREGLICYRARAYVDASGDADIAALAGAEFAMGDDGGKTMPFTHCFILSNVDSYAFQNYYDPALTGNWGFKESPLWAIKDSGKYPHVGGMCCNLIGPGTVGFNAGHLPDLSPLITKDLSQSYMDGRKVAEEYLCALKEFFPAAFGNAYLVATAPSMGIRESRRIAGDYTLTIDDYFARRAFADDIAKNIYIIDLHRRPDEQAEQRERYQNFIRNLPGDEAVQPEFDGPNYQPGESHGIPYRCLIPQKLKNLIVAGRTVSCDRMMLSSVRVMPTCLAIGEGAGVAAALTLSGPAVDFHTVDTEKLRNLLKTYGAYLPN